jgi:hypothetical protein
MRLKLLCLFLVLQVAVKRVIPPRRNKNDTSKSKNGSSRFVSPIGSFAAHEVPPRCLTGFVWKKQGNIGNASTIMKKLNLTPGTSGKGHAEWKKRKADFIKEMCYLSKLRHPCK